MSQKANVAPGEYPVSNYNTTLEVLGTAVLCVSLRRERCRHWHWKGWQWEARRYYCARGSDSCMLNVVIAAWAYTTRERFWTDQTTSSTPVHFFVLLTTTVSLPFIFFYARSAVQNKEVWFLKMIGVYMRSCEKIWISMCLRITTHLPRSRCDRHCCSFTEFYDADMTSTQPIVV